MGFTLQTKRVLFHPNSKIPINLPPANARSIPAGGSNTVSASPSTSSRHWTQDEHSRFLDGLALFPNGPWKAIAAYVGTRTYRQTKSHAQKYLQKIQRHKRGLQSSQKKRSTYFVDAATFQSQPVGLQGIELEAALVATLADATVPALLEADVLENVARLLSDESVEIDGIIDEMLLSDNNLSSRTDDNTPLQWDSSEPLAITDDDFVALLDEVIDSFATTFEHTECDFTLLG